MRRARAAALDLPLTVRLNQLIDADPAPGIQLSEYASDDQLEIDMGGGSAPVAPPFGQYSGVQDVTITGQFGITGLFSRDSIAYGAAALALGARDVAMKADSFSLLDFSPSCSPSADPLLQAGLPSIVSAPPLPTGDRRGGVLNWFSGDITLKLYTQFRFNSLRRGTFSGSVFSDDCTGSQYWTSAIQSLSNPVIPIQLAGHFDISPGLTTDGRLRLFKVIFDDAVIPQVPLAAVIHTCTTATTSAGSGTAPSTTCDGVSGDDSALSATIKVKKLTAEVLIGDA